jgi:hypothetical protein
LAEFNHAILGSTLVKCITNRKARKGGDFSSPNVGSCNYFATIDPDEKDFYGLKNDEFTLPQRHAASYRMIVDLREEDGNGNGNNDDDDEKKSMLMMPLGQSGNVLTKNYDSLLESWSNGEYELMEMDVSGMKKNEGSVLKLFG